jgi:hypothetical protein
MIIHDNSLVILSRLCKRLIFPANYAKIMHYQIYSTVEKEKGRKVSKAVNAALNHRGNCTGKNNTHHHHQSHSLLQHGMPLLHPEPGTVSDVLGRAGLKSPGLGLVEDKALRVGPGGDLLKSQ